LGGRGGGLRRGGVERRALHLLGLLLGGGLLLLGGGLLLLRGGLLLLREPCGLLRLGGLLLGRDLLRALLRALLLAPLARGQRADIGRRRGGRRAALRGRRGSGVR